MAATGKHATKSTIEKATASNAAPNDNPAGGANTNSILVTS